MAKAARSHMVEVKYCSDRTYLRFPEKKEKQHFALDLTLKTYGYQVVVLTYILGFCASTHISNQERLKTLGIEHAAADKLNRKVCDQSVFYAHNINKASSRFLESFQTRTSH